MIVGALLAALAGCAQDQKCSRSRDHAKDAWLAVENAARAGVGSGQMAEMKRMAGVDPAPPALAAEADKQLLKDIVSALGRGDVAAAERDSQALYQRLKVTELHGLAGSAAEATTAAATACKK